jgi:hypothetical protein
MADFTYEIPNERRFLAVVQQILTKSSIQKEKQIGNKLNGAKCSIVSNSQYSQRWNAYQTSVHFYVPIDNLDFFDEDTIKIF